MLILGELTYFLVLIYEQQSISSLSKAAYKGCIIPISSLLFNCFRKL